MKTCHISKTKLEFRASGEEWDGLGSYTHERCRKDYCSVLFCWTEAKEAWVFLDRAVSLHIGFFPDKTKELLHAACYLGIPKIQQHSRLY